MRTCVECAHLNLCSKYNEYTNKYDCTASYSRGWRYPTDSACDDFCEAYYRTSEEKNRALKGISDGCFIVTAACDLLGISPEHDSILKTFKDFKRNYLMQRPELYRELVLYESLGPAIAHQMIRQKDRATAMAKNLHDVYFPEIINNINEGMLTRDIQQRERKLSLAYGKYRTLVMVLAQACGFEIVRREDLEESMVYSKKKF